MKPRQRQPANPTGSKNQNITMTSCHKGGIKIQDAGNGYRVDPFAGVNPFKEERNETIQYDKSSYDKLDLDIDNYSRNDLYNLFGLKTMSLTEDFMKECKKIVLKTHPDKSQLVFDTKKDLKEPKNFNKWFNDQFDKHKLDDPNESGYGSWLKSDDDIVYTPNVTKSNMAAEMEKRKKEVQTLSVYTGVGDTYSSALGGSSLMMYDSNFSSGTLFSNEGMGYTDLRQAYVESVIPVTEEDYKKTKQFKSIDEYKRHRDSVNTTPLSKEEAMRQLYRENKNKDEESAALAFYYAQQSEKSKQNQDNFWSGLKQVTNW